MLQEIFYQMNWGELLGALILAAIGPVLYYLRNRIKAGYNSWKDVLSGLRAIPELSSNVEKISYYVAPNGGGSLHDAVKETKALVLSVTDHLDTVVQTMWAENDTDDEFGRYYADAAGANTYVNQLFARWLSVGKNELMGWGFLNFIHPDDIERMRRHWETCRIEKRQYRLRHRMVSATGQVIEIEVTAIPIMQGLEVKRWIGSIRKVQATPNG